MYLMEGFTFFVFYSLILYVHWVIISKVRNSGKRGMFFIVLATIQVTILLWFTIWLIFCPEEQTGGGFFVAEMLTLLSSIALIVFSAVVYLVMRFISLTKDIQREKQQKLHWAFSSHWLNFWKYSLRQKTSEIWFIGRANMVDTVQYWELRVSHHSHFLTISYYTSHKRDCCQPENFANHSHYC